MATAIRSLETAHSKSVMVVDRDRKGRDALQSLLALTGFNCTTFERPEDALASEGDCLLVNVDFINLTADKHSLLAIPQSTPTPVIFLSADRDIPFVVSAIRAGAADFIESPIEAQAIRSAVSRALDFGEKRRNDAAGRRVIEERLALLTPRERQVMRAVADGYLNKQTAHLLGIAEVTVKLHRGNVMRKMQLSSVADLIKASMQAAPFWAASSEFSRCA